jgi:hypothetical protein
MRIGALTIVLMFCLGSNAYAADSWQEPEDFRGFKWGATIEDFEKALGNHMECRTGAIRSLNSMREQKRSPI